MKKSLSKLFIIFGVILCIFAFVGCDLILGNAEESSSETVESSENNDYPGEEISETEYDANDTYVEETLEDIFEPDEELVEALVEYLQNIMTEYDVPDSSISIDIDKVKDGAQPLQLKFDPDKYYYVCAYYSPEHLEEEDLYCCAKEYTWVGFSNEKNIAEYYNGVKLCAAFQINKTDLCVDLFPIERNVPTVQHFQMYFPAFEDEINTAEKIAFADTAIYFNSSNANKLYLCSKHIDWELNSCPYIELDENNYITLYLYTDAPYDGYERRIRREFGDYYDILTEIMITDKYIKTDNFGRKLYYGLFEINEFVDKVLK